MSQQPPHGGPEYPQNPQNPQEPLNPYPPQQPQQPPYGQQPGYQPYGQQYPPNPYGAGGTQAKSHTTRNVLIIVTVLVVLFCGGITTAIVVLINNADDAFDSAFDTEYEGSEDDPIAVEEGEEFSIRGFDYEGGWSVVPDGSIPDYVNVEGLSVTNDRDDEESQSIYLVFEFLQDEEGVGEIRCSSDTSVRHERKVRMTCNSSQVPSDYDAIEVYDTATFE